MNRKERWEKIAFYSAVLLLVGYVSSFLLEFSFLQWVATGDGKWRVESADDMSLAGFLFFISTIFFSIAPAFFYIPALLKTIRNEFPGWEAGVSGKYALYYFALYQVACGVILILYMLFPYPWFSEQSLLGFVEGFLPQCLMVVFALFLFGGRLQDIGFVRPVKVKQLLFTVIFFYLFSTFLLDTIITVPIADYFHFELDSWREEQISGEVLQAKSNSIVAGILEVLMVGLFVPVAEEVMFRGVLQTAIVRRFGAVAGVLGSSLLFGAIHVDPVLFPPLFAMGLMLGFLRHYYQSIWAAIFFHALNNTITVLIYFFQ
ncbi:CPBP family intramembrane metalloprotease [Aneurinibacillus sp. BA2021]|nr:CPBP family intramembrane metalloprotease [Aneurinibacillus sp. BA2021]